MVKHKILLLEDDTVLAESVCEYLEESGFDVAVVHDGVSAQDVIYESQFDLYLLDVNVPGFDGFSLLKEVRKENNTVPAIFLTSRSTLDDVEEGYESGCDDYLKKPFELRELLLRIQTLIKRTMQRTEEVKLSDGVSFLPLEQLLLVENQRIELTNKELRLLKLLLMHRGHVVSHEMIYEALWDYGESPSESALRTYIKELRKKIGKESIVSLKRLGYKLLP